MGEASNRLRSTSRPHHRASHWRNWDFESTTTTIDRAGGGGRELGVFRRTDDRNIRSVVRLQQSLASMVHVNWRHIDIDCPNHRCACN